ncbi:hypothetical protein [Enterococcus faecium]|uniref:hypothetical protein n=1 Tax=Enterococcus faecium TaxID=1352 RepID=UPI000690D7C9|nr:hypothetical protein [Enterococcus faecium]
MIGNPSLNHRYRKGFYSLFKTLQQNHFDRQLTTYKKDQFDLLLDKFIAIQTENTQILSEYVYTNNQIIEMLIGGMI